MALSFTDNSGNNITHGSDASIDNPTSGTLVFWLKLVNTSNTYREFFVKMNASGTLGWVIYRPGSAGSTLRFEWVGTSTLQIYTAASFLTTNWMFIAVVFNKSGANGDQKMYKGSLTSAAVEATYGTQLVGSGHATDAAETFRIGSRDGVNECMGMSLGFLAYYPNVVLSLEQIIAQQFNTDAPVVAGCKMFYHYGIHGAGGTGTQKDWSGSGNDGTLTGAAKIDHPPIQVFSRPAITQELAQTLFPAPVNLTLATVAPVIGYTLIPAPINLVLSTVNPVVTTGANKYPWYAYPPMIRGPF